MTHYQDDKREKADELVKKECEAHSCHSISLHKTYIPHIARRISG